jgi:hypothetical protein
MTDFRSIITMLEPDGVLSLVMANAAYKIVEHGTSNIKASGNTDSEGNITVQTLPSGHYDIIINGEIRHSFHHVTYDYATKFPEAWIFPVAGTISSDSGESANIPVFAPGVAGRIESTVYTVEHIVATGDVTVHLLGGDTGGASALTVAANSLASYRAFPQAEQYRHSSGIIIPDPVIPITADQAVTIGWDYVAGTVEGLTVKVIFKPT